MADIVGSPYAVRDYVVPRETGGDAGLAALRARLAHRGVSLILDFVPNHTAVDHRWVRDHPEWYVHADPEAAAKEPAACFAVRIGGRSRHIAHGRDPNLPAWPDTAQLDYRVPEVRSAMADTLRQIAIRCDGVRCDMAMLVLDDVFTGTWAEHGADPMGSRPEGEFWWHAIRDVKERFPGFTMIAEAYWDLEYRLQRLGFDYTYDKALLDRLRDGPGEAVVGHLRAESDFQRRSVRFLENHDEPRAAAVLTSARHRSAALVVATVPGMLLLHDGQLEGARLRAPVELGRRPVEPTDDAIRTFYARLLAAVSAEPFRVGTPVRLEPRATWDGDTSHRSLTAWLWMGPHHALRLAVANVGAGTGRCFLPLPLSDLIGRTITFEDLLSDVRYERDGLDLLERGLFLELPADGHHLFRILGHALARTDVSQRGGANSVIASRRPSPR